MRPSCLLCLPLLLGALGATAAPSLQLEAQGDAQSNRLQQARLALPLGERGALGLRGGRLRSPEGRATLAGVDLGYEGERWSSSVELTQRRGKPLRQQDARTRLTRHFGAGSLGVDAGLRRQRAGNEQARSQGLGLHGSLRVTEQLRLHAAAQGHKVRLRSSQQASDNGLLGPLLNTRATPLQRDELALTRSLQLGSELRIGSGQLSLDYLRDRALGLSGPAHTLKLGAALPLTEGLVLAPSVGRTRVQGQGGVNFAGVAVEWGW